MQVKADVYEDYIGCFLFEKIVMLIYSLPLDNNYKNIYVPPSLLWTSISLSLYWSLLFFWPNLPSHQDPIPPFPWNLVPTCPLHGSVPQACSRCYSSFGSVPIIFIRLHRRVCNTLFPSFYFIPGTSITLLQSDKDNRIKGDACHVWSPLLGHFTDSISNPHKHLLRQIMPPIYK